MSQYNTLNVKFSNSQLIDLKSTIKNKTEVSFFQKWIKFFRMIYQLI